MRIVAIPRDEDGPGCYRVLYPLAQLSAQGGHQTILAPHEVEDRGNSRAIRTFNLDIRTFPACDLVVMAQPVQKDFAVAQKLLQSRGTRVIVELDDDYLNLPDYNPAKKNTSATSKDQGVLHLMWCLRHADGITVSTPALRDSVQEVLDAARKTVPVYVLRNFLDWRVWERRDVQKDRGWKRFRVGYLGMAQWHSGDLKQLNPWFGEWIRSHPDVEFVAASDHTIHDLLGIPEAQRVTVASYDFRHQEVADYAATMDVGLVPLVRNKFNEAKSHLKGMEYAGVGVPCLATPTESYRDWWLAGPDGGEGGAGYLCARPDEWIQALDRLRTDEELRKRMGARARQLASENTIQDHWRLWENAYGEVLSTTVHNRAYAHGSGKRVSPLGVYV